MNIDIDKLAPYAAGIVGAAGTWWIGVQKTRNQARKEDRSSSSQLYKLELQLLERSRQTAQQVVEASITEMRNERKHLQDRVIQLQERVAILEAHQRELEIAKEREGMRLNAIIGELQEENEYLKSANGQLQAEVLSLRLEMQN